jgi:Translation initiation factor IF-2, N-terminal region
MATRNKVRVSDLAKELKQDTKRIISELRREDADVNVPSDSVNKEIADKIRGKYFPKLDAAPRRAIKIIKRNASIDNFESAKVSAKSQNPSREYIYCKFCSYSILEKNYERHLRSRCPQRKDIESYSANQNTGVRSCYHCGFKSKVEDLKLHYPECAKRPNAKKNELSNKNNERSQFNKLGFHILPPGQWSSFDDVLKHFRRLSQTSKWENRRIDENRLQKIEERFHPDDWFVGNDELEGYVVCCFDQKEKVVLECPLYGHAIYIIKKGKSSWLEIAKATKLEARTKYSDQVKVIYHTDSWLIRLEHQLKFF